ncbi:MAG: rod shape-determining protein MreD [Sedimentisphaerales bacterium]|nr:rod shape-determining protein MreD [Sedimentisphaerales bacterium]
MSDSMRWIRFIVVVFLITVLDAGNLLNLIATPGLHIRPDLLLIAMVFFVSHLDITHAMTVSFFLGFVADVSGELSILGPYTLSFGIFGSLLCQLRKVVLVRRMLYQALTIFVMALLIRGLAQLLLMVKAQQAGANVYVILWGTAAYSAVFGPFAWMILSGLTDWLGLRERPRYGPTRIRH